MEISDKIIFMLHSLLKDNPQICQGSQRYFVKGVRGQRKRRQKTSNTLFLMRLETKLLKTMTRLKKSHLQNWL